MSSLIRTNWERNIVQISESPNYRSAIENVLIEVIKWTSRVFFRQYNFILKPRVHVIKSKNISLKNILGSLHNQYCCDRVKKITNFGLCFSFVLF
jgi:hypothetical protein